MLNSLTVRGFKSLVDVGAVEMAPLTVFFGPNAVGKSNLFDAVVALSRLATARTVAEALEGGVRGLPLELFSFPDHFGLPGLLSKSEASCELEADLNATDSGRYRYRIKIAIKPSSGTLSVEDEYLTSLTKAGTTAGRKAVIERQRDVIRIRRRTKPAHPWEEKVGLNHAVLSNNRYSGKEYAHIEAVRKILSSFRTYYLDPRTAMRQSQAPREVVDIGPLGEHIAPFLYRLKAERPKVFQTVRRTLATVIPGVDDLLIDLDDRRGVVNVEIRQRGTPFSSRVVSEGTLRVLALVCVATNPWGGSLIAFEEPENGVHPRRVELIARILGSLAFRQHERQQVILTTHSPVFCNSVRRLAEEHPRRVRMYRTVSDDGKTRIVPFEATGPLFADSEIRQALTDRDEEMIFEGLLLRGLLDD